MDFLAMPTTRGLGVLRDTLTQVGVPDPEGITRLAAACIDWERKPVGPHPLLGLQERWYHSLTGEPDYSVYDVPEYIAELWTCWAVYSRKYLRALSRPGSLPPGGVVAALQPRTRRVLDVGCGFGVTTATLTRLFPDAAVTGTNLPGTVQWEVASRYGRGYGFPLVTDPTPADLLFASEYFEHFPSPIEHLRDLLPAAQYPRALIIANTFNSPAIGHFTTYTDKGESLTGRQVSRRFNDALRSAGYRKVPTRMWNQRPTLWIR